MQSIGSVEKEQDYGITGNKQLKLNKIKLCGFGKAGPDYDISGAAFWGNSSEKYHCFKSKLQCTIVRTNPAINSNTCTG